LTGVEALATGPHFDRPEEPKLRHVISRLMTTPRCVIFVHTST